MALDRLRGIQIELKAFGTRADSAPRFLVDARLDVGNISGVGAQFTADAATYDERYFSSSVSEAIRKILSASGVEPGNVRAILDIGCGSGNATFGLAKFFPDARIIASDLSPDLLQILGRRAEAAGVSDRISLLVANAETLTLEQDSFDLICGSSMLHHLQDPDATVRNLLRGLRSGGVAFFFEPFAAGYMIMRQAFRGLQLGARAWPGTIPNNVLQCLDTFVLGIDVVTSDARDHPVIPTLDDKWLFSRRRFENLARALGCSVEIKSTSPPNEPVEDKVMAMLVSALGEVPPLPDWASEYLTDMNRCRPLNLHDDLMTEGSIVFQKA